MTQEEKNKLNLQLKIIRDSFFSNCISTKDKQLLLEDLSARLFYGVKVTTINPAAEFGVISGISIEGKISVRTKDADIVFECTEVKPYLRPMSDMTEEEKEEFHKLDFRHVAYSTNLQCALSIDEINWLNKKGFDYRGLIERNLALDATDSMYNLNKK
jgi:hypothetical protein